MSLEGSGKPGWDEMKWYAAACSMCWWC